MENLQTIFYFEKILLNEKFIDLEIKKEKEEGNGRLNDS